MEIFPDEPNRNKEILKPFEGECKIYWGTNKWGNKEWIGKLFPNGTREKEFKHYYISHFNAIALQATHFADHTQEQLRNWAEIAEGKDFVFCPQMPQSISHYGNFSNVHDKVDAFYNSLKGLGSKLGPVFMKVNDRFAPEKREETLFEFFRNNLPKEHTFFLQLPNQSWYEEPYYSRLLSQATAHRVGMIIADIPGTNFKLDLTIPKCFIRYHHSGNDERLKQWVNKIKEWKMQGLQEAYFFIEAEQGSNTIEDLDLFGRLINE